jgi:hypothetical protein
LSPNGTRVTGAALWKTIESEGMLQVGGNVGKGKFFTFSDHTSGIKRSYVIDVKLSSQWNFYKIKNVAPGYILCYPLSEGYVLSVHISGLDLESVKLAGTVQDNEDLFHTINHLVGGNSR